MECPTLPRPPAGGVDVDQRRSLLTGCGAPIRAVLSPRALMRGAVWHCKDLSVNTRLDDALEGRHVGDADVSLVDLQHALLLKG